MNRYVESDLGGFSETEFYPNGEDRTRLYYRLHPSEPESDRRLCPDWHPARCVPLWFRGVLTERECCIGIFDDILTRSRLRQNQLRSHAEVQAWERWLALELVGPNPFRPIAFDPAWRTEVVTALARIADETAEFGNLPVLADALEEAGCDVPAVLTHLRGPGPHVRGCWAVDLVLGKG